MVKNTDEEVLAMTVQQEALKADPLSKIGEAIDAASGSIGNVTSNATVSAKVAARKVKDTASSGAYNAAYGLAFGAVFSAVFLVELLPENNVFRRGFEDGAEEGFDAAIAKSAARRARRRTLVEAEEDLGVDDDDAPAAQETASEAVADTDGASEAPVRKQRTRTKASS